MVPCKSDVCMYFRGWGIVSLYVRMCVGHPVIVVMSQKVIRY